MSFFERMIKLNQLPRKDCPSKDLESLYNEQETAPNRQGLRRLVDEDSMGKKKLCDGSLKSSISLNLQEGSDDQGWGDIFEQPLIKPAYKEPQPVFLHHLLPKKQQMMREMLARKRQFQLKKMSLCAEKKGAELQSKIHMESEKFKLNQSLKLNQFERSKTEKMKSSSVKAYSGNKPKPLVTLGDSICSAALQTQMLSSPVADNFNKEIMMKLLDIIQKDRNNHHPPFQSAHRQPDKPTQMQNGLIARDHKESPIIINNIMRTPMEGINRELIQREMKIRMLQNTRSQRQYSRQTDKKSNINHQTSEINEPVVLTERNSNRPSPSGFKVVSTSAKKQSSLKQQQLLQQRGSSYENTLNKENEETIVKKDQIEKIVQDESTKNNSNQNSRVNEPRQLNTQKQRKRQFQKRATKKEHNKQANQFDLIQDLNFKAENVSKQYTQNIIKAPVKLEIPLENQSIQGLTLAQAFKKKIGRLKSQQKRSQKTTQRSVDKKSSLKLQSFPSQTISITDKMTQYPTDVPIPSQHSSKVISICIEDLPSKRGMPSKNTSKQSSVKKERQNSNKKSTQPSKELMDRLIYGERAKISKQEMYALTKKNYNNLPEVRAKKQEEQKRRLQQQRINKAKEYQKAIRSGKSQLKH